MHKHGGHGDALASYPGLPDFSRETLKNMGKPGYEARDALSTTRARGTCASRSRGLLYNWPPSLEQSKRLGPLAIVIRTCKCLIVQ